MITYKDYKTARPYLECTAPGFLMTRQSLISLRMFCRGFAYAFLYLCWMRKPLVWRREEGERQELEDQERQEQTSGSVREFCQQRS